MKTTRPTPAERLAAGLEQKPNGCLEWTGYTNAGGYGKISVNNKPVSTHRTAWELANGPIPDGLHVLHHCDNPPCCETEPTEGYPEGHLFLGTKAENTADMNAKGRHGNLRKTQCINGHAFDEANTLFRSRLGGGRACRACQLAATARYRDRQRIKRKQVG